MEAEAPRVECRRHGVVVARVAWARHGRLVHTGVRTAGGVACDALLKTAVCELMRICWPTVGRIIERVAADERLAAAIRSKG